MTRRQALADLSHHVVATVSLPPKPLFLENPISSGDCWRLCIHDRRVPSSKRHADAEFVFPGRAHLGLGEQATAHLTFLVPAEQQGILSLGMQFALDCGASGRITKILDDYFVRAVPSVCHCSRYAAELRTFEEMTRRLKSQAEEELSPSLAEVLSADWTTLYRCEVCSVLWIEEWPYGEHHGGGLPCFYRVYTDVPTVEWLESTGNIATRLRRQHEERGV